MTSRNYLSLPLTGVVVSERVGIIVIAVASRFVASGRAISMRLVLAVMSGRLGRRVVLDEETEENDENGLQEEQERDVLHPTRRSWMLAIARRHFSLLTRSAERSTDQLWTTAESQLTAATALPPAQTVWPLRPANRHRRSVFLFCFFVLISLPGFCLPHKSNRSNRSGHVTRFLLLMLAEAAYRGGIQYPLCRFMPRRVTTAFLILPGPSLTS